MQGKPGDRVLLHARKKSVEGLLMPSSRDDSLVLKLDSGYNIGFLKSSVSKIDVLSKAKKKKIVKKKHVHAKNKKTISILHTGGTIASKVDYETGAVAAQFLPEELVAMFPELEDLANIESRLIGNMWSEDMHFAHYNHLAKEIQKEAKKGVAGVIITHGTDTIHYTSAALAFILEGLSIPVLIVGAQRSSDRGSSDAAMNLLSAIQFIISQKDFADVGVCMHASLDDSMCWILPGLKCRKMHSSRRDAFQPVNAQPWALVDYRKKKIELVDASYRKKKKQVLTLRLFKDLKVGLFKAHPNMFAEELALYKKFDGLVIEGYGLAGNFPINPQDALTKRNGEIVKVLGVLAKKIPVVATSQTVFGRVNMQVYSTGVKMQGMGILGNYSTMSTETSFIKLAWLLSNYPKKVKEMFSQDLRGEMHARLGAGFL